MPVVNAIILSTFTFIHIEQEKYPKQPVPSQKVGKWIWTDDVHDFVAKVDPWEIKHGLVTFHSMSKRSVILIIVEILLDVFKFQSGHWKWK